ncbi:MAG TPA: LysR family transcriptional regulator substrate-binding protein, partial [Silvibacterium sp.]|nr:LysR family transcriptional regulator substrate-binding protein [Silvibacterium sp.]
LRSLSIDVAILSLPLRHKEFELFPLRTEPMYAVLPKAHPRARAKCLSLKELSGEQFVMLRDGHCFRDVSLSACTRAKVNPRIAFESGQFSSLLGMVAAGVGVSLVPKMARDKSAACSYVRIMDVQASRTIVAAVLRSRSFNRVQQAFVEHLRVER